VTTPPNASSSPIHVCITHRAYRLTCREFAQLQDITPGRCQMCGERTSKLVIDHDHGLGFWAVRGLVCETCNVVLGKIEGGVSPRTATADRYLAAAWHARQVTTEAKRQRARPRKKCPVCERDCAINKSGKPRVHWCRLPGRLNEICPASM
jgi:hypothetical protein